MLCSNAEVQGIQEGWGLMHSKAVASATSLGSSLFSLKKELFLSGPFNPSNQEVAVDICEFNLRPAWSRVLEQPDLQSEVLSKRGVCDSF